MTIYSRLESLHVGIKYKDFVDLFINESTNNRKLREFNITFDETTHINLLRRLLAKTVKQGRSPRQSVSNTESVKLEENNKHGEKDTKAVPMCKKPTMSEHAKIEIEFQLGQMGYIYREIRIRFHCQ